MILHLSDLHFAPRHLKWVVMAMEHAIAVARDRRIDAWVISGDSFDATQGIHEPCVAEYLRLCRVLADIAPGAVLYGTASHDHPGSLEMLRTIGGKHPIYVADQPATCEIAGVLFSFLPSLNKADPAVMDLGPRQWVQARMLEFSDQNSTARISGTPTVLVTHGTVTNCLTESKYAMVSPDHEFDVATLATANADAVMLGHIHKHQSWHHGHSTIAYAGSIARLVHGHHDDVGCLLWDVRPDGATFERIICPSRKLMEIEFDGPPDLEKLREATADLDADTAVRIRWDVDQEYAHIVDQEAMREILQGAGEVKLEGTINPVVSVRAAGIGAQMPLHEKLEHWARTTGDEDRVDELQRRLDLLLVERDPQGIADGIG